MEKITIEFYINEAGELKTNEALDSGINLKLCCMALQAALNAFTKMGAAACQEVGVKKIDTVTVGYAAECLKKEMDKSCLTPKTKHDENEVWRNEPIGWS